MKPSVYIKSILEKLFGENAWVQKSMPAPAYFVAAGNPVTSSVSFPPDSRPEKLTAFAGDNDGFIVAGSSMAPMGIQNGDAVVCVPVDHICRRVVDAHKYVVIKVDKEWYDSCRRSAMFDYKLRYTVAQLPPHSDFNSLYEIVKQQEDSVLLPDNKREFKRKYEEAVKYYGADIPLVLSLTFKEGRTHYSVHPADLIEYEVIGLGQASADGTWTKKKLPAA